MQYLKVIVRNVVTKYPSGSFMRLRMIAVVRSVQTRFTRVINRLNGLNSPIIPRLDDDAVGRMLYYYCDLDRKKSIEFLKHELEEADLAIKDLES